MPTATTNRLSSEGTRVGRVASGEGSQVAGQAVEEVRNLTSAATERTGEIVQVAKQDARQLAETVKERAGDVTDQVSTQTRSLLEEARQRLETQARAGSQRVVGTFQELGEQAQALAEGRPEDAPALTEYVWRAADGCYAAADRLHTLVDDVEARGVSGVLDDLQGFARRRPGTFLLGAVAVGFGIGRLVKAESAERELSQGSETGELESGARPRVQPRTARTQAAR